MMQLIRLALGALAVVGSVKIGATQQADRVVYASNHDTNTLASVTEPERTKGLVVQRFSDGNIELDDAFFLPEIKGFCQLQTLLVIGSSISDKSIKAIAELPHLKAIAVVGGAVSNEGLQILASNHNLQTIVLKDTNAGPEKWLATIDKAPDRRIEVLRQGESGEYVDKNGFPTAKLLKELQLLPGRR